MPVICSSCGSSNKEDHRFCYNCGSPLSTDFAPPTSPSSTGTSGEGSAYQGGSNGENNLGRAPSYVVKTTAQQGRAYSPEDATMPVSTYIPPAPTLYHASSAAQQGPTTGYQGYGPGASTPAGAGVAAPYAGSGLGTLERPRDNRVWLMPVIAVAALVLLGLGVLSGYFVMSNRQSGAPAAATGSCSDSGSGSDSDRVKQTIRCSNDAQIKAWQTLDITVLKGSYADDALRENEDMVRQLQQNNMYALPVNQKLDIVDVKVTGDTATARTVEVWTVTFYNKADGKKIKSNGPDTLHETYYLVKRDGKWVVRQLKIDGEDKSTPGTDY